MRTKEVVHVKNSKFEFFSKDSVNVKVIAITGPHRSGKTTLANFFKQKSIGYGFSPLLLSFGSFVKAHVANCLNISVEEVEKLKSELAMRQLLQSYGDVKRKLDENTFTREWEEVFMKKVEELADCKNAPCQKRLLVLVDDLYLVNEFELLREYSGLGGNVTFIIMKPEGEWSDGKHNSNSQTKTVLERAVVEKLIKTSNEQYAIVTNVFDKHVGLSDLEEISENLLSSILGGERTW